MSSPYLGEIRIFAGNFGPAGWAICDGRPLAIAEYDSLFALIGTTYGGDGQETFRIPDLQGRVPVHMGQGPGIAANYQRGEAFGVEDVTLATNQMPVHNHALLASTNAGTATNAQDNVLSASPTNQFYTQDVGSVSLANTVLAPQGGSQPHNNVQPYITINYIISLFGVYPSEN
jgi:microcystin-dependent protein